MEKIIGEYRIIIKQEDSPESPRTSEDNLGTMVCFHTRFDLGDDHPEDWSDCSNFNEIKSKIIRTQNPAVILPLYLFDHGGQTISTSPFGDRWDSGMVGFIFVSKETVRKEYGTKNATKRVKEIAKSVLEAEVESYDQWMQGEVYEYEVWKGEELIDSCSGFYGKENCLSYAIIDNDLTKI